MTSFPSPNARSVKDGVSFDLLHLCPCITIRFQTIALPIYSSYKYYSALCPFLHLYHSVLIDRLHQGE